MKLLHLIPNLDVGGAERSLVGLARGLSDMKHDLLLFNEIIAQDVFKPDEVFCDISSLNLGYGLKLFSKVPYLKKIVSNRDYDLVLSWTYHCNLMAALAKPRIPLVWNIRHGLDDFSKEKLKAKLSILGGRLLSTRPQAIVFNSERSRQQHLGFGYHPTTAKCIPNGIDTDYFSPMANSRSEFLVEQGISQDRILVGTLCRYHPVKGISDLVKAFSIASQSNPRLHLVLGGRDMTLDNSILAGQIRQLELLKKVTCLGPVVNTPKVYSALDFYISSSHGEGFPNSLAEAMACGTPCVATDVGDSRLILSGMGWLCLPKDPNALASTILLATRKFTDLNRDQIRTYIIENFSKEKLVSAYRTLLLSLSTHR